MARNLKKGLDYFPLDVNFLQDIKVRKIIKANGTGSISILICLLCNSYRDEGYYMQWDEDMTFLVADEVGTSEGAVLEVLNKALQVGFFEKSLFEKYKIITSKGMQERYIAAVDRRKEVDLTEEYLVNGINVDINRINVNINTINAYNGTQRKVKESKVKESKGEREDARAREPLSPYGSLENVFLTMHEHEKVVESYQEPIKLINKIGTIVANSKKTYKSHYALLLKIALEDSWPRKNKKGNNQEKEEEQKRAKEQEKKEIQDLMAKRGLSKKEAEKALVKERKEATDKYVKEITRKLGGSN